VRPQGEISLRALMEARRITREREARRQLQGPDAAPAGVSVRDLMPPLVRAGVGRAAVRYTVANLARSGALQRVQGAQQRVAGVCRPLAVYVPAAAPAAGSAALGARQGAAGDALADLQRVWHAGAQTAPQALQRPGRDVRRR
jgi:hypothetical protein